MQKLIYKLMRKRSLRFTQSAWAIVTYPDFYFPLKNFE